MNKVKKLMLKAKKTVFSEKVGNNSSIFKGEGYDFVELREYQNGDDIRKIDWNITAKFNTPYIKMFQEEREINVVTVSLLSGSTYFGSRKMKQDLIAEIVSLIGFSAVKNMDMFSSFIFSDKDIEFQKGSKSSFGVEKAVENILNFNPIGKGVNAEFIIDSLIDRVKKRSLIFIISDFYEPLNLKYLSKHSEVIAIIVRDKLEENPSLFGEISLVDSETEDVVDGNFGDSKNYQKQLRSHDKDVFENMKKNGVKILKIYTDSDVFKDFKKFFQ